MISKASVSFSRISPRKVRYVIDLIREKSVLQAESILHGSPRRAGGIVQKLLAQAVDAAQKNSNVDSSSLYVSKVLADGGPVMKRFRAMSMGRAGVIRKRTSHITLELDLTNKAKAQSALKPAPKQEKTAPVTKTKTKAAAKTQSVKAPAKKKLAGAK